MIVAPGCCQGLAATERQVPSLTIAPELPKPYALESSQVVGGRRYEAVVSPGTDPNLKYSVGTTNILSSVDVARPQRMTMAIGV